MSIPVDATRITLVATGKVHEIAIWENGKRVEGRVATDENGVQLWSVDCMIDDDESFRSEVIGVRVPSPSAPMVAKFQPVTFSGLTVTPRVNRASGQLATYWAAESVDVPASTRGREAS